MWRKEEKRSPPPHPHFICCHMGDVLRAPAARAGCWAERMATSRIDLQCGLQIKPQDKRLGGRTMQDDRGPHGKDMTTGRSGRLHLTTAALILRRNGVDNNVLPPGTQTFYLFSPSHPLQFPIRFIPNPCHRSQTMRKINM